MLITFCINGILLIFFTVYMIDNPGSLARVNKWEELTVVQYRINNEVVYANVMIDNSFVIPMLGSCIIIVLVSVKQVFGQSAVSTSLFAHCVKGQVSSVLYL